MISVLRRLGRWLCRYDLEPVRQHFWWEAGIGPSGQPICNWPDPAVRAEALSMLRILNGDDPADVSKEP